MAHNYCPGYEGVPCYSDPYLYNPWGGYQGGQNVGGSNPGGASGSNPGTNPAPGGPRTGFPGAGNTNPLPTSQNAALGGAALDEGAIFWLALIGIVLLVK